MDNATSAVISVMQRLQGASPDAPNLIMGDFNRFSMDKSLSHFCQYVTCPTRHGEVPHFGYGAIRGACNSYCKAPLDASDHNAVHLVPLYPLTQTLNHRFKRTNWDV